LNIYRRYVPSWLLARAERALLTARLLADTIQKQRVEPHALALHADRGASMASKPVAFLLADLGVTKSHSQPHGSNDSPYSESQFKTLRYRPDFPQRFGSIEDARAFCRRFFTLYNQEHRHSGIASQTLADLHHGRARALQPRRAATLDLAYLSHRERSMRQPPQPPALPSGDLEQPVSGGPYQQGDLRSACLKRLDTHRSAPPISPFQSLMNCRMRAFQSPAGAMPPFAGRGRPRSPSRASRRNLSTLHLPHLG
jgi:putative transposase